ncbi:hypothetical protein BGZ57DRAFT_924498 [Hyaloscypha finlandica]|nr:hypothetical protein BGZ57DRAFT_924498 [Hyaloscypha finlandica]
MGLVTFIRKLFSSCACQSTSDDAPLPPPRLATLAQAPLLPPPPPPPSRVTLAAATPPPRPKRYSFETFITAAPAPAPRKPVYRWSSSVYSSVPSKHRLLRGAKSSPSYGPAQRSEAHKHRRRIQTSPSQNYNRSHIVRGGEQSQADPQASTNSSNALTISSATRTTSLNEAPANRLGPMWRHESLGSVSCAERISSQNGGSISSTDTTKTRSSIHPPTHISNTSLLATAPAVELTVLAAKPMPMGPTNVQNLCFRNEGESTLSDLCAAAKCGDDVQSSKNVKAGLRQIQQRGHLLMDQASHTLTKSHLT